MKKKINDFRGELKRMGGMLYGFRSEYTKKICEGNSSGVWRSRGKKGLLALLLEEENKIDQTRSLLVCNQGKKKIAEREED